MRKQLSFGVTALLALTLIAACGSKTSEPASSSNAPTSSAESSKESSIEISSKSEESSSSSKESSTSKAPKKTVTDLSISLGSDGDKAYITVRGTQSNYTADEFKWAWGLKEEDNSTFADGKAQPDEADYKTVTFDDNNQFTVKYCLTDITTIKAGTLYRIYGGTPETYGDIPFESNMFGASDATRKYYLRQDKDNSLMFESIQPLTYSLASIVEVAEEDLPDGVTQAGAYLKVGGVNSKNLTMETINGWNEAGNIAGDFQRVIPADSYSVHAHANTERFWKIEGNNVFFYLYCGFIGVQEGWMVHFDLVSGNQSTGLQTSKTFNGETAYTVGEAVYKIYSDKNKSGEENYWGCLGVYREAVA